MRKLIAGFAVSLDGYIEGPNGEYDWIIYDQEQFNELAKHWERMDAMFYGRKTYEVCMAMQSGSKKNQKNPFAHMKQYVFSQTLKEIQEGFILVNGDLEKEVIKIKKESGKDIAVFGGAELVSSLINLDLIDELVLAICPVVLGKGKPFFINIKERKRYRLKEVKSYTSGLVSLTYER
jgi:dihydrofolate reductase